MLNSIERENLFFLMQFKQKLMNFENPRQGVFNSYLTCYRVELLSKNTYLFSHAVACSSIKRNTGTLFFFISDNTPSCPDAINSN